MIWKKISCWFKRKSEAKIRIKKLIKTKTETIILQIIIRTMEVGINSESRHIKRNTTNNSSASETKYAIINIINVLITEKIIIRITEVVIKITITKLIMTYKIRSTWKKETLTWTRNWSSKHASGNIFYLRNSYMRNADHCSDMSCQPK